MAIDAGAPPTGRATLIGLSAVLMWATLAVLTAWSGRVPPFQLAGMAFTLAFLLAAASWVLRGGAPWRHLRQPPVVWLLGVAGLFGYHFFYFFALRNAPPVEASLIAYLWPLLIVFMSALLPSAGGGGALRWYHVAGALLGLAGTALIVTGGGDVAFQARYAVGYAAAVACALTWSSYSVLSRRFAHVPSDAVGGFCGATAVLAWACHFVFETTIWPAGAGQWLAVAGLGLGPVGLAFFTWDHGVKHGDIRVLGASSYGAPLISTLILIAAGLAPANWTVGAACGLIVGGALIAGQDLLRRR